LNLDDWLNANDPLASSPALVPAADGNPAQAAEAVKQARRNNIPPSLVGMQPDPDIARQNKIEDTAAVVRSAPTLDQWLATQPAPVATSVMDDVHHLSAMDQVLGSFASAGKAIASGVPAFSEGFYGATEAAATMLPDIVGDPLERFAKYGRQSSAALKDSLAPPSDNWLTQGIVGGFQSFGSALPALAVGVATRNPLLAAEVMSGSMAGMTFGQSFGEARDKGLSAPMSVLHGAEQGAVEYITEKIPALTLFNDLTKGTGLGKLLLKQAATEIPGEQVATLMQDFNDWVNLNPEKSLGEFMAERPDAALTTLVATVVGTGAQTATASAASSVARRLQGEDKAIKQATETARVLTELNKLAGATQIRDRDVETFEGFLQSATEGTPLESVYIDAGTLADSGVFNQLMEASPVIAEQMDQARGGTMIRIPVSEVLGRFHVELTSLIPDMRTDPNGLTQREAEAYVAERGPALQAEVERVLQQDATDTAAHEARTRVKDSVAQELMATGRVTKDVADAYSTLTSTFYHVMGQRMGMNAEQLYGQERLRILGQGQGEFGQNGNSRRERLRAIHADAGVSFVDATIDRGGAHTPAGPNSGSPAYDVALNGTYPEDFYGANGLQYYGTSYDRMDYEAYSLLRKMEGSPNGYIAVYRAVEKDGPSKIMPGDWVTIVRGYAKDHGESALAGNYKIIKMTVHPRDIYTSGDSMLEWGYHPQEKMPELPRRQPNDAGQFYQTATVRSGRETLRKYGLKPSGKYSTRQVAAALEARQRAKYGSIDRDDRSDAAAKRIAKWMMEEVEFEMQHPDKSGAGWYSEKYQRALDAFAEEFPELKTDQNARDLLTALVAITSDGQKVLPNFLQAVDIYSNFRSSGKFTTNRGHIRQASILNNLERLQELHDTLGPEAMREYLLQEFPVSQLKKIATEAGLKFSTDYQATVNLPMSAVLLGPKLGAFYANLMGAHGYLTMDRWWSRTFNRYRGSLITSATKSGIDGFKQIIGRPDMSDDEVLSAIVAPRNALEARGFKTQLAVMVGKSEPSKQNEKAAWMKAAREKAGAQFDELLQENKVERAANTLYKYAFENIEDTPFNATDRTFMLRAVAEAGKMLSKRGIKISVADIQAVLWYYEKRLYGELGARQTADISYEEAAKRVVELRKSGVDTAERLDDLRAEQAAGGTVDEALAPARKILKREKTPKAMESSTSAPITARMPET
jgi:hypothetical protein